MTTDRIKARHFDISGMICDVRSLMYLITNTKEY